MKKLGLLVMPFMTMSFLASCGMETKPTHNMEFKGTHCSANNKDRYKEGASVLFIVTPNQGYILPESIEVEGTEEFKYEIKDDDTATFTCVMPEQDVTVTIGASAAKSLTFNGTSCTATNKNKYAIGTEVSFVINSKQGYMLPERESIVAEGIDIRRVRYTIPPDKTTAKFAFTMPNVDVTINVTAKERETYSVSINSEVVIAPIIATEKLDYVGTITINSSNDNDILPASLNGINATNYTYTRSEDYKTATLSIPAEYVTKNVNINVTLEDSSKVWYLKDDWWNYCSNGAAGQQATIIDVGQEVKTKVNGLDHKVRLIDIDHDTITSSNRKAHCTFEFANAICDESKPLETVRNDEGLNSIYINKALDIASKSIVDMLDEQDLKDELKNVTKKVMQFPTGKFHQNDELRYMINDFSTKMFPLAQSEMGQLQGYDPYLSKQEGDVYTYYNKDFYPEITKRRIKLAVVGEIEHYWTRTPYPDPDGEFGADHTATVINSSDGGIDQVYDVDELASVAPAFCI